MEGAQTVRKFITLLFVVFVGGLALAVGPQLPLDSGAEVAARVARDNAKAAEELRRQAAMNQIEIDRARATTPAVVVLTYVIGGAAALGLGLLIVGGAGAFVFWLSTRARIVYPGADGQMPIIITPTLSGEVIHDPNRAIGASTMTALPSAVQAVKALAAGETMPLPVTVTPVADAALQMAVNAAHARVQLVSAATREGITRGGMGSIQRMAQVPQDDGTIDVEPHAPRQFYVTDETGATAELGGTGDAPQLTAGEPAKAPTVIG